jgi:hypothetical protein
MRTAWLLPFLLISLSPACSDDDGGDGDDAAGRAASNVGGAAGRGAAGAGGAGCSGAAGAASGGAVASSGAAGSASSSGGAAGSASSSGGAAGTDGSSSSDATGCEGLCARPLVCPGATRAECLSSCEDAAERCPDPSEALLECGESLSDSDFQCVGGVPIPNDDLCITESAAFARCRIGF